MLGEERRGGGPKKMLSAISKRPCCGMFFLIYLPLTIMKFSAVCNACKVVTNTCCIGIRDGA